jgi:transketolase
MRLAALMKLQVIYVFTHDSVGVGEDGPTHQPIEHVAALRAIPNLVVVRPADANETVMAWKLALIRREGPTAIILTRQKLPIIDQDRFGSSEGVLRGGYILAEAPQGSPEAIIMATGSEVYLALAAYERLTEEGIAVRVVSMPSWEVFEDQEEAYREEILPSKVKARVGIEAGISMGWYRYVGSAGKVISIQRFGASAPADIIFEKLGFTPEAVVDAVKETLGNP